MATLLRGVRPQDAQQQQQRPSTTAAATTTRQVLYSCLIVGTLIQVLLLQRVDYYFYNTYHPPNTDGGYRWPPCGAFSRSKQQPWQQQQHRQHQPGTTKNMTRRDAKTQEQHPHQQSDDDDDDDDDDDENFKTKTNHNDNNEDDNDTENESDKPVVVARWYGHDVQLVQQPPPVTTIHCVGDSYQHTPPDDDYDKNHPKDGGASSSSSSSPLFRSCHYQNSFCYDLHRHEYVIFLPSNNNNHNNAAPPPQPEAKKKDQTLGPEKLLPPGWYSSTWRNDDPQDPNNLIVQAQVVNGIHHLVTTTTTTPAHPKNSVLFRPRVIYLDHHHQHPDDHEHETKPTTSRAAVAASASSSASSSSAMFSHYYFLHNTTLIPYERYYIGYRNPGHLLWQDLWSLYTLVSVFDLDPLAAAAAQKNIKLLLLPLDRTVVPPEYMRHGPQDLMQKLGAALLGLTTANLRALDKKNTTMTMSSSGTDPNSTTTTTTTPSWEWLVQNHAPANPQQQQQSSPPPLPPPRLICARHALTGTGLFGHHATHFQNGTHQRGPGKQPPQLLQQQLPLIPYHHGHGALLRNFRQFMLRNLGIHDNDNNNDQHHHYHHHHQTIIQPESKSNRISVKTNRMRRGEDEKPWQILVSQNSSTKQHRSVKLEGLMEYLRRELPSLSSSSSKSDHDDDGDGGDTTTFQTTRRSVELQGVVLANHTVQEQVRWLVQTNVLITAAGGGAALSIFLPPGAHLILLYQPWMLDWDYWNNMAHIHVHWVPLSDLVVTDDDVDHDVDEDAAAGDKDRRNPPIATAKQQQYWHRLLQLVQHCLGLPISPPLSSSSLSAAAGTKTDANFSSFVLGQVVEMTFYDPEEKEDRNLLYWYKVEVLEKLDASSLPNKAASNKTRDQSHLVAVAAECYNTNHHSKADGDTTCYRVHRFMDEERSQHYIVPTSQLRPYRAFRVNDSAEILVNHKFLKSRIVDCHNDDGTYDIFIEPYIDTYPSIAGTWLRRAEPRPVFASEQTEQEK
ncbi:hypothetical protein ACA910_011719 [Epithemia clementina (nom. ined.)]